MSAFVFPWAITACFDCHWPYTCHAYITLLCVTVNYYWCLWTGGLVDFMAALR